MGDDNVSPTQNKIWPVLTGQLRAALLALGCFLSSGGWAQVEVSAKEKAKQKVFTRRSSEDPPMPSCEAEQQRRRCLEFSRAAFFPEHKQELKGIRASQHTQTKP